MEEDSGEGADKASVLSGNRKECEQQAYDVFAEAEMEAWWRGTGTGQLEQMQEQDLPLSVQFP